MKAKFWQLWQTAAITVLLVMLMIPRPSNFISYVMGVCLGVALIHWVLYRDDTLSRRSLLTGYALPYFVFYALMTVSCFFSDRYDRAFVYCWRYSSLLLVPLVFIGMTPSFFTGKRLQYFTWALVAGAFLTILYKAGVFVYTFRHHPILVPLREQGERYALGVFLGDWRAFIHRRQLLHPAFEALFMNLVLALILNLWTGKEKTHYSRGVQVFAAFFALLLSADLFLFCTKTAAIGVVLVYSIFAVRALVRKRYGFALCLAALLCAGGLTVRGFSGGDVISRHLSSFNSLETYISGGNSENDGSVMPRIYVYKLGWEMFEERPVTGWGPAYGMEFRQRFAEKYLDNLQRRTGPAPVPLNHPHNQFLASADSMGFLGPLVFLWIFAVVFREVWRRKSLFWWLWFAGLLVICTIDVIFNRTAGFIYLCGFHGVLFCENYARSRAVSP